MYALKGDTNAVQFKLFFVPCGIKKSKPSYIKIKFCIFILVRLIVLNLPHNTQELFNIKKRNWSVYG